MSYKTILTVVTSRERLGPQLEAAIAIARQEEAHLDVLCLGVDMAISGYYYAGAASVVTQATSAAAQEDAEKLGTAARARMSRSEIAHAVETVVALDTSLRHLVARRARFCDMVVLDRPYGPGRTSYDEAVMEAALFDGMVPVLMLPEAPLSAAPGNKIVLAWNESDEAFSAMRKALPKLRRADLVSIAIVDPRPHGENDAQPGEELARLLNRHGAEIDVALLTKDLPSVSAVLCRHARDIGADLVVMGAYGHSRLRESIVGGATRNMLEQADLPVLLAH